MRGVALTHSQARAVDNKPRGLAAFRAAADGSMPVEQPLLGVAGCSREPSVVEQWHIDLLVDNKVDIRDVFLVLEDTKLLLRQKLMEMWQNVEQG